MLQLSTVCTKLAQAAALTPSLQLGINAWSTHKAPKRLDSPLLLRWAVHMGFFSLPEEVYPLPGLAQLLATAENATKLRMNCSNVEAAAQAHLLMCSCSSVTQLELAGAHMPSILPLSVKQLLVCFDTVEHLDYSEYDARQPNVILYHAARLPFLEQLHLYFPTEFRAVHLSCPAQLGRLQKLKLELSLSNRDLNVSWVASQPCSCLAVVVGVDSDYDDMHAAMVQQLSYCQLTSLTLHLCSMFTPTSQSEWGQLAIKESLCLVDGCSEYGYPQKFNMPTEALLTLPRCANIFLDFASQCMYDPGQFREIYVGWGALTSQASHIRVLLGPSHRLFVVEAEKSAPEHLQQPWQLVVCGGLGLQGLPPSQPTDKAYLLQNAAARCQLD